MTVKQLTEEILAHFATLTGYTPAKGSEFELKSSVYAAQMSALYDHLDWIVRACFPQTAMGDMLDRHALMRGLTRRPGVRAAGEITFSRPDAAASDIVVPAGTVCLTEGLVRFETLTTGVIAEGEQQVVIPAAAALPGPAGNILAGRVTMMSLPPAGVAFCTNAAPFSGGCDEEDDEALRVRVLESFLRLPNGANAAYYEREALSIPGVAAVNVLPRVHGRGTVGVVVAATSGSPSDTLLDEVAEHLESIREIAVDVTVSAPVFVSVDCAVRIMPRDDFGGACAAVEQAITAHFTPARLGQGLRINDLEHLLYTLPEVNNFRVLSPAADLAPTPGALPRLGTLSVTPW